VSVTHARPRQGAVAVLVVVSACTLLSFRLRLVAAPDTQRLAALTCLYVLILFASLAIHAPRGPRLLHPAVALIAGMGALLLATAVAGRAAPVPFAPTVVVLSLVGAVAEEALFRRTAYSLLAPRGPVIAVAITALVFAAIHLPLYGVAAFPVDLGAGLLLGWQRHATGSWSVPATTHVAANLVAVIR
jgi:membrane protease YdiL (CAAX protease family)